MSRLAELHQQITELQVDIDLADERRRKAALAVASSPSDRDARAAARAADQHHADLRADMAVLLNARATSAAEDASDAARERRQHGRACGHASVAATHDRASKTAPKVDKAIARLAETIAELVADSGQARENLIECLKVCHAGEPTRERSSNAHLVLGSEIDPRSHLIPAIGRALGQALKGLELPNIMLDDWLQTRATPCGSDAVAEAAKLAAQRFETKLLWHMGSHIPDDTAAATDADELV